MYKIYKKTLKASRLSMIVLEILYIYYTILGRQTVVPWLLRNNINSYCKRHFKVYAQPRAGNLRPTSPLDFAPADSVTLRLN